METIINKAIFETKIQIFLVFYLCFNQIFKTKPHIYMKKLLLISAFLISNSFITFAQDNAIKFNPLAFLGGTDLFSIEHAIKNNNSIGAGLGFSSFGSGDLKYTQVGAEGSFRHYTKESLKGFYLGGSAGFSSGKVLDEKFNSLKIGARIGNQWVFDSGFVLDIGGGISYRTFNYTNKNLDGDLKTNGIWPGLNISLGYAF